MITVVNSQKSLFHAIIQLIFPRLVALDAAKLAQSPGHVLGAVHQVAASHLDIWRGFGEEEPW